MKIAVYVEGQAELIFVRELLSKWYDYDASRIGFRCYNLRDADPPGHPTEYSYGDQNSYVFYEIVNVGNDTSVLSMAIKNAKRYRNLGYDKVVALRDMFSDHYHAATYKAGNPRVVDSQLNERFISGAEKSISDRGLTEFVHINFAIMEVETWFLGMGWYLQKENPILTQVYLKDTLGLDLNADQEFTEYHPADHLHHIYRHIGSGYDKHRNQVNSIMAKLDKTDFEMLLEQPKCQSFNRFISNLIPA